MLFSATGRVKLSTRSLTALGFYKPARLSLRGAIENVMRSALVLMGQSPANISVSQMFEDVKSHGDYLCAASAISQLKDCYATLCRTSHTVDVKFMAQKVPFAELIEKDSKKFDANLSIFTKVSASFCALFFVMKPESLAKLTPDMQDLVHREVPKAIKKAILNA